MPCGFSAPSRKADWLRPVSYTHLDVYKRQDSMPLNTSAAAGFGSAATPPDGLPRWQPNGISLFPCTHPITSPFRRSRRRNAATRSIISFSRRARSRRWGENALWCIPAPVPSFPADRRLSLIHIFYRAKNIRHQKETLEKEGYTEFLELPEKD